MNEQDRAILAYAKRALDDPDLNSAVQYDRGFRSETKLRAYLPSGMQGTPPAALVCDPVRVERLIDAGYLSHRDPWLTITRAGEAALTGA